MRALDLKVASSVLRWGGATSFYPSTKIQDTWVVVNSMHQLNPHLRFSLQQESTGFRVWFGPFTAFSGTAQRSICLAALKALGVDFSGVYEGSPQDEESLDMDKMRALYDGAGD